MKIKSNRPMDFQPVTITIERRDEALAIWHRMNVSSVVFGQQCVSMEHKNGESATPFDDDIDHDVALEIWRAVDVALHGQEAQND